MRDYEVFKKWLDGVLDLIWGAPSVAQKFLDKEMKYAMKKKPTKRKKARRK